MPKRKLTEYDRIAIMASMGLASAFQKNLLAKRLTEECRTVALMAAAAGKLRRCDVDDATQDAVQRTWKRLAKWDDMSSGIVTYASIVAHSVCGDWGRKYGRQNRLMAVAAEQQALKEELNANR